VVKSLRFWSVVLVAVTVLVVAGGAASGPARASYPGEPGLVAYSEGGEVHTMNPDGSDRRRLTFDGGTFIKQDWGSCDDLVDVRTKSYAPAWTPDGREVAFLHHTPDDRIEVRAIDPAVGAMRVLFSDWQATMPTWSPDGSRIAYGDASGVWVADADGSGATLIATPSLGLWPNMPGIPSEIESVAWSPDGKRLAFNEWSGGGCVAGRDWVSVIDVDGGNRHQSVCQGMSTTADWAPDGAALVCDADLVVDPTLVVIEPDGSIIQELTEGSGPVWSPGGTEILYGLGGPWREQSELWSYDLASSTASRLLAEFRGDEMAWQPVQRVPYPIGLVDPTSGVWRLADVDGYVLSFYYGNPGDYPFVGDWDCDGIDTPGLYRQSDGYVYLRNSNTQGVADVKFYFGNPGDIPLAGDFDNDGCDTVSLYRPSLQRFYIINELGSKDAGLGAADYWFLFGNPGDKPVVGDWDGDGADEIGLHRESAGFFYFRDTLDTGIADGQFYFGNPADRFIAGDWGIVDGKDTPGVYRPGNTTFYFRHILTQGNADSETTWGEPAWLPVAGDFGPH